MDWTGEDEDMVVRGVQEEYVQVVFIQEKSRVHHFFKAVLVFKIPL